MRNTLRKIIISHKTIISINLATVGCWFFLFYPLKYLEPSVVGGLILCVIPLSTIIIGKFIYHKQNIAYYDYIIAILVFLMGCYLVAIGFLGDTAVKHIPVLANILSVICCFVVSISLSFSNIHAKKLSDSGFSPLEILSVRFILLTTLSGAITFYLSSGRIFDTISVTMLIVLIAAISVIIIPQILYQSAVRELQPITIAMVLPFMPVMTFLIEFYDKRLSPDVYTIIGIMVIICISITGSILRYKQEKKSTFSVIPAAQ